MIFKRTKQPNSPLSGPPEGQKTLIAHDVTIEGNVTAAGELHIDGTVYGAVRARSCVIDLNGYVHGEIEAHDVFIRGRVVGPIRGTHVNLYAGAQVEGDILNESISIENGANVYGMISRAEVPPPAPPEQLNGFGNGADHNRYSVAPTLSFPQENGAADSADDSYRPIKVVRP